MATVGALLALTPPVSACILPGSTDPGIRTLHDAWTFDMQMRSEASHPAKTAATKHIRLGRRHAVPQLACQPGDKPETGLQGRVPPKDVISGRFDQGYS